MPLSGQIRDTWRTGNAISNIGVQGDLANPFIRISILDPIIEQLSSKKSRSPLLKSKATLLWFKLPDTSTYQAT
jgi:hypothetical protein